MIVALKRQASHYAAAVYEILRVKGGRFCVSLPNEVLLMNHAISATVVGVLHSKAFKRQQHNTEMLWRQSKE